jgi:fatty acid desaturase
MLLLYINLLFLKYVHMFHHKSKGECKQGDSSSSSQAQSATSADLFAVIVLFNFYLHILIYYEFTASFDIFYPCFCLRDTSASRQRWEALLGVLNILKLEQPTGAGAGPTVDEEQQ